MQVRTFLINCCSDFNKLFFRICSKKNVRMHRFHAKLVLSVSFPFFAFIFSQFFGAANFSSLIFEKLILLDQLCSLM